MCSWEKVSPSDNEWVYDITSVWAEQATARIDIDNNFEGLERETVKSRSRFEE